MYFCIFEFLLCFGDGKLDEVLGIFDVLFGLQFRCRDGFNRTVLDKSG